MNLTTFTSRAAAALVALIAGAASWEHIASVAYGAGERPWVAYSLPAAIDGLILVGVAALLADRQEGRVPRVSARFAVVVGVLATLAANIASAEATWTARLVAVAAPVSFLLSVEVLTRTGRLAGDRSKADNAGGKLPQALPDKSGSRRSYRSATSSSGGKRSAAEKVAATRERLGPGATQPAVAKAARVSVRTAARYWHGEQPIASAKLGEPIEPDGRRVEGVPEMADA